METEQTRDLITRYYAALRKGDRDTLATLVADDCVWEPPASAPLATMTGGPAIVAELAGNVVKTTFDLSEPFAVDVRSMIVDGDTAAVQQRITATAKATGAHYDNQYCWIHTCRDGQIVHMEEYADTLVAKAAMGW
ncbi:MAG: nuclear transport factor 2 family protein [Acidimicrobiales bacterium]